MKQNLSTGKSEWQKKHLLWGFLTKTQTLLKVYEFIADRQADHLALGQYLYICPASYCITTIEYQNTLDIQT